MWLVETFLWANERLKLDAHAVALSRDPKAFARKAPHLAAHAALEIVRGDVRDFAFPAGSFSHVVHAATDAREQRSEQDRLAIFDTIVTGTRHTLDLAVQAGATRFLLTSSGAVYGPQPLTLSHVAEDYQGGPEPTSTSAFYGEGKRVAELLCAACHREHGLTATIARCFAFVGPYLPLDVHFAAGNFLRDALAGRAIDIQGDGTPLRSYLYAADLAVWLWTILFRGQPSRPYNVGSDEAVSVRALAQAAAQLATPPLEVRVARSADPAALPVRYVPAVTRARDELSLAPEIPLAEALHRTFAWHRRVDSSAKS